MQQISFSITLSSPSFLDRRLYATRGSHIGSYIECTICFRTCRVIAEKSSLALECGHMIQCTECRDYNLEKILRCENCCSRVLSYFPGGCSTNCPRNTETIKASALCVVCSSHLRKEARCCRQSNIQKQCKKQLRSCMTVLVQRPSLIPNPTPKDRPCSHYTLCQFCQSAITKGHRSSTACKACRKSAKRKRSSFVESTESKEEPPRKKRACTLGTLAEIASQESINIGDNTMSNMSNIPKMPTISNIPRMPSISNININAQPKKEELRFGSKCGVPIWALVN